MKTLLILALLVAQQPLDPNDAERLEKFKTDLAWDMLVMSVCGAETTQEIADRARIAGHLHLTDEIIARFAMMKALLRAKGVTPEEFCGRDDE